MKLNGNEIVKSEWIWEELICLKRDMNVKLMFL